MVVAGSSWSNPTVGSVAVRWWAQVPVVVRWGSLSRGVVLGSVARAGRTSQVVSGRRGRGRSVVVVEVTVDGPRRDSRVVTCSSQRRLAAGVPCQPPLGRTSGFCLLSWAATEKLVTTHATRRSRSGDTALETNRWVFYAAATTVFSAATLRVCTIASAESADPQGRR